MRERREEIPQLVQHYLERCSREMHKTGLRFAEETMEYLILYKWPGNVRQLANEVRRLVAFAESGAVLMPEHLSSDIASSRRTIPASERDLAPMARHGDETEEFPQWAWDAMRKAELFSITIGERWGGAGLGDIEAAIVLEELGRADVSSAILAQLIFNGPPRAI